MFLVSDWKVKVQQLESWLAAKDPAVLVSTWLSTSQDFSNLYDCIPFDIFKHGLTIHMKSFQALLKTVQASSVL